MATTSKDNKENPVLKQEKDRLAREFVHLEKTRKTGLSSQEYAAAKKSLEKKQHFIEQKEKQENAKEKAVEEILGSASILPASHKSSKQTEQFSSLSPSSSPSSEHEKKRHQKYFMKLDTPKQQPSPSLEKDTVLSSSKVVSSHSVSVVPISAHAKKISDKTSDKSPDTHTRKHIDKKVIGKIEKKKESEIPKVQITSVDTSSQDQPPRAGSEIHQHVYRDPSVSSSFNPSVSSPSLEEYKDIDDLAPDDENHWRFALALLTIFLLILLFVKFTSYGNAQDVITVDAYLDPTSSYSQDMYLALQSLIAEYDDVLWVDYHLTGATAHATLISHAMFCAEKEGHGTEYLSYYFGSDVLVSDLSSALSYATALGLDSAAFETCLSDASYTSLYAQQQEQAKEMGITYTPTLLINNKKIVGAVGADAVKVVLDQELTKMG